MLEPWGERGYEFRHALLAEAVSDDLLPAERLQLHRACVEALRADPSLGSSADLARHALAAGDRQVALEASVLAGNAARRMGGPAEALEHYEAALTLADADADPDIAHDLTLRAAAAATASGRTVRAMAFLRSRLDTDLPTDHQRAELISALVHGARMTEERVDGLALTEQALALLADDAPVGLRVGLLTRRAEALMDSGASAEAWRSPTTPWPWPSSTTSPSTAPTSPRSSPGSARRRGTRGSRSGGSRAPSPRGPASPTSRCCGRCTSSRRCTTDRPTTRPLSPRSSAPPPRRGAPAWSGRPTGSTPARWR